jgi:hypothetical protein
MAQIEEALAPVRAMLAADGYQLAVAEGSGVTALLTITAGPEACEYCLVPKSVLESIAVKNLRQHGLVMDVALFYPGDQPAS